MTYKFFCFVIAFHRCLLPWRQEGAGVSSCPPKPLPKFPRREGQPSAAPTTARRTVRREAEHVEEPTPVKPPGCPRGPRRETAKEAGRRLSQDRPAPAPAGRLFHRAAWQSRPAFLRHGGKENRPALCGSVAAGARSTATPALREREVVTVLRRRRCFLRLAVWSERSKKNGKILCSIKKSYPS